MKIKFIVNIILLNINLFTEESYLNNNSSINIDTSNENIKSEESNTETLYTSTFSNENKLIDGDSENVSSSQNNLNIIELSNINNDNNKNNVNTIPTISHTVNNLSNPNYSHPYKKNNITSKYIIKKKEINDNFLIQEYVQNNFYNPVFIEDKSQLNHDIKWLEINKKTHLLDKYKKRISSLVFWYFIAFNFVFITFSFLLIWSIKTHIMLKTIVGILLILLFDILMFRYFFYILKSILIRKSDDLKYYLIYYNILKSQFQLYWKSVTACIFFWVINFIKIISYFLISIKIASSTGNASDINYTFFYIFKISIDTQNSQKKFNDNVIYFIIIFIIINIIIHFFHGTKPLKLMYSYTIKEENKWVTYYEITEEAYNLFQGIQDQHNEIVSLNSNKDFLIYEKEPKSYYKKRQLTKYKKYEIIKQNNKIIDEIINLMKKNQSINNPLLNNKNTDVIE